MKKSEKIIRFRYRKTKSPEYREETLSNFLAGVSLFSFNPGLQLICLDCLPNRPEALQRIITLSSGLQKTGLSPVIQAKLKWARES